MMAALGHSSVNEDDHPALLLAKAHELTNQADELAETVKAMRLEAARLRSRAERYRDGAPTATAPKREKADPLLSAAALAVEDLPRVFTVRQVMDALQIRNQQRGVKLLHALAKLDLVAPIGDGDWRAQDPEEARVRDGLRELGTCSPDELAAHLEMPADALASYIEDGARRGWADVAHDGHLMYLKPGPERIITRHPVRRPPEKDPPTYADAPARGEAVRVVHHGKRGGAMSNPGVRHRLKLRDARREKVEAAKAVRAEEQRARAARDAASGRRRKK